MYFVKYRDGRIVEFNSLGEAMLFVLRKCQKAGFIKSPLPKLDYENRRSLVEFLMARVGWQPVDVTLN